MSAFSAALEAYLRECRRVVRMPATERSYYPALRDLFDAVGRTLKPSVSATTELAGEHHPDLGLFEARGRSAAASGAPDPDRGVVEVKLADADIDAVAGGEQVQAYRERYGRVLVTNLRELLLVTSDPDGRTAFGERFTLAESQAAFDLLLEHPRREAIRFGDELGEYLARAFEHQTTISEPRVLARLLASHARDARHRVHRAKDDTAVATVREALEGALGIKFEDERGAEFFRSTLVQTLFYGVFAAWVQWSRSQSTNVLNKNRETEKVVQEFSWRESAWLLRSPVLRTLFQQLADPGNLEQLDLVEVLDWAQAALARVEPEEFLQRFASGEAAIYFYEPFLEAFDPDLRKQLGVWYTPAEVVEYMVAEVDRALQEQLGIAAGLADEQVYVLDPCCGTGAYLAAVLRRIMARLSPTRGALAGAALKRAVAERVFGFEIMPAPFVIAHLQIELALAELDAELQGDERAGVYLTNALTGWEPQVKKPLPFAALEREREQADAVKQERPILVILGNPPYNGFAGVAVDEERELSEAYKSTRNPELPKPQGQGLNDLYVRFFRMAERRIADKTGKGIVCFISNYSWLDGLSHTGMRERLLNAFDVIRIDNLHGDRIISEYAPDGRTSETIMAIQGQSPGIRIGTAIALFCKTGKEEGGEQARIRYRDFEEARAEERRASLIRSLDDTAADDERRLLSPNLKMGLPFKPMPASPDWFDWPALPDLFPVSFPGVKTSRDAFLVDVVLERLGERIGRYFDPSLPHEEITRRYPSVMRSAPHYDARAVRDALLKRGGPIEEYFVRYAYRPFDVRWLYWERDANLVDRKREDYFPHVFAANRWISAAQHIRRGPDEPQAGHTRVLGSSHHLERGAAWFPLLLRDEAFGEERDGVRCRENLSELAQAYVDQLGASAEDLFLHALSVMHDPIYLEANAGGLKMGWPRIPLPETAAALRESAACGRMLSVLLDVEQDASALLAQFDLADIALPAVAGGGQMQADDFAVRAGWGHYGAGNAVMPGPGRIEPSPDHPNAVDIYLNDRTYWANIPTAVWEYRLGGYQVLKKWLSYREEPVLGRRLNMDEVTHFQDIAQRIAAIQQLTHPAAPE